ncbi:uncharacterized protein A4U43_C08F14660 [Asparagus officinalis]|nr:uncharacterized protein A4U43_C08F14660 [Asparagus officinalis]
MRFFYAGKELIPLNDEEEQVDYGHDDTDAYLIKPDDEGNFVNVSGLDDESDFGIEGKEMPLSLPLSGHFEPAIAFECTSSILTLIPKVEMTKRLNERGHQALNLPRMKAQARL